MKLRIIFRTEWSDTQGLKLPECLKFATFIPIYQLVQNQKDKEDPKVNEPGTLYKSREIHIFSSFEEQEAYEMGKMAELSSQQILEQLYQFITIAYGMHGYDPNNLPNKHSVKIIKKG